MVSRIMRGHVMAAPFPLSDRASDVRPGCKTQRIAPTLPQVADLMGARIKEREYFKTCIVGHRTFELLPPVWANAKSTCIFGAVEFEAQLPLSITTDSIPQAGTTGLKRDSSVS
ncbi:hypothetical protein PoB_004379500 [Plakobranchus ocellatus]|uniref:Uncharacterized protein n=1 Tax=Plakobranchus ocellatus TaxID=259542 RepID=A0AAV4B9N4_9GAST|nr:hypothetical protein PoB_004379500 [Plakobranchus ocellatus]